ncbi:hypothetical protein EMIHUDRAFT_232162 [Emiliania huxleyi CCMP1516]|uniref:Uncharacterized protein n=2 Tax=Emiliania huxleyi TaxID=2903 RepID=A0A0D3K641_EMIH1|nr:hypothetical protein EMIHUDRAFT_232162 [Emiliania huxleyi CCMP1516]EOD31226.1 hypothetical protein EMIHUDRAFT_232162 [Emiliania huxleyi CCMP1516]|eukprot:XP_005783655.1 hypothetical protein EMIHUDRAFT_232162 [Emiliania huxleyi CCMP1516]
MLALAMLAGSQPAASCDRPLRACYDAMGGQSWKNAAGRSWLDANIPCCEKAFVTCHKEKEEIRTIAWRSIAGLMGTIPPQLGLLTSLEEINEIDLEESYNCGKKSKDWKRENCKGFSGTIPPEIGMATKLEAPALDQ